MQGQRFFWSSELIYFIIFFQATNWMRLRSDLGAYLDELREKGAHESDLAKLIKSHISDKDQSHQESLEKQKELERMRQVHSQLVASHQKLKNDHQKLIGKNIFSWVFLGLNSSWLKSLGLKCLATCIKHYYGSYSDSRRILRVSKLSQESPIPEIAEKAMLALKRQ